MGFPMAGHLAAAGHSVTVYNPHHGEGRGLGEDAWRQVIGKTPAEAAAGSDIVFCCVGNDQDLRSVTTGDDGAFAAMKPGTLFVDHTTASAEVARELSAAADKGGFAFIDAPVVGRPGRRRDRQAHRDVRWRAGGLRQGRTVDPELRQGVPV